MANALYTGNNTTKYKIKKFGKKLASNRKKLIYAVITLFCVFWIIPSIFSSNSNGSIKNTSSNSAVKISSEDQLFFAQFEKLSDSDKEKLTKHLVQENYLMNKPDDELLLIAQSIIEEFGSQKGDSLDDEIKSNNPSSSQDSAKASSSSSAANTLSEEDVHKESLKTYRSSFLSKILKLLISKEPSSVISRKIDCELPDNLSILNIKENNLLSLKNLQKCLGQKKIDDKVKNSNLHNTYATQIKALAKNLPLDKLYDSEQGIVIPAGGKNTLLAMGIVSLLREVGSELPIEIYIPPRYIDELDSCNFMSTVSDPLKKTSCISNSADILDKVLIDEEKQSNYIDRSDLDDIFALLVSTSRQTLLIDPLYFPLKNIDYLFEFEKFTETGMLLWPRSLHRLTSPVFYEMIERQPNLQKRNRHGINDITNGYFFKPDEVTTPLADLEDALPDKTIDSRIILVDKNTQIDTLLISLYYQVFGQTWYNFLLEMKGDEMKFNHESYMASLYLLNKPYYLLNTINDEVYFNKKDNTGTELQLKIQYDPVIDYKNYAGAESEMATWTGAELQIDSNTFYKQFYAEKDLLFASGIHPAMFDPIDQFKYKLLMNNQVFFRYIESADVLKKIDIELVLTKNYVNLLCKNRESIGFYAAEKFTEPEEYTEFCKYLEEKLKFLKK